MNNIKQLIDEISQTPMPVEPHNVIGKFIDDAHREDRRVRSQFPGDAADGFFGRLQRVPVFKETAVFLPGDINQDPQIIFESKIQKSRGGGKYMRMAFAPNLRMCAKS